MTGHGIGNELLGQLSAFARRNQPAYDVATEDVQNDVEMETSPLGRPLELGDVPRPDLVGCEGQQFRLGIGRVATLAATLSAAGVGGQQTVMLRRLATGTTSQSMLGTKGRADTGASSVALRAPCDAPVSTESPAACICALGCLLIFIPTSLLSKLTGVGAASHSGTGGKRTKRQFNSDRPWENPHAGETF